MRCKVRIDKDHVELMQDADLSTGIGTMLLPGTEVDTVDEHPNLTEAVMVRYNGITAWLPGNILVPVTD